MNEPGNHSCLSCGAEDLYENKSFRALPRVASDSATFQTGGRIAICLQCGLIQKIIDERWKSEINAIYGNYKMYELTEGSDQILISEEKTRADKILDILSAHIPPDFKGSVIDIGCGTGGFLNAFGRKYPQTMLYGQEINDRNLHYLERIPNFKTLFTSNKPTTGQTFDIIVSIHCFEHVFDYAPFFDDIEKMQKNTTRFLFQVPDVESSPFDIVIADHAAHFSQNTLQNCLSRYAKGFAVSKPIQKELTAIRPSPNAQAPSTAKENDYRQTLDKHVHYLVRMLDLVKELKLDEIGVYGTTIAGTWLTAACADKIAFYVDDDPLKQGKIFHKKNIIAASQVPDRCKIFLPFGSATIHKILGKYPHLEPLAVYCE